MKLKSLVTGAAGFIGSHLAERLVAEGYEVIGVDCFTDYYPRLVKERNLAEIRNSDRFRFVEADLRFVDLEPLLDGLDYVFHQAAQAGVSAPLALAMSLLFYALNVATGLIGGVLYALQGARGYMENKMSS